jgi:hypothetical protein
VCACVCARTHTCECVRAVCTHACMRARGVCGFMHGTLYMWHDRAHSGPLRDPISIICTDAALPPANIHAILRAQTQDFLESTRSCAPITHLPPMSPSRLSSPFDRAQTLSALRFVALPAFAGAASAGSGSSVTLIIRLLSPVSSQRLSSSSTARSSLSLRDGGSGAIAHRQDVFQHEVTLKVCATSWIVFMS